MRDLPLVMLAPPMPFLGQRKSLVRDERTIGKEKKQNEWLECKESRATNDSLVEDINVHSISLGLHSMRQQDNKTKQQNKTNTQHSGKVNSPGLGIQDWWWFELGHVALLELVWPGWWKYITGDEIWSFRGSFSLLLPDGPNVELSAASPAPCMSARVPPWSLLC